LERVLFLPVFFSQKRNKKKSLKQKYNNSVKIKKNVFFACFFIPFSKEKKLQKTSKKKENFGFYHFFYCFFFEKSDKKQ
jgi:hypothetical protein